MEIVVSNERCTGCRSCEFACSYHHAMVFNPKLASLHIRRVERDGEMFISFYSDLAEEEKRERFPCDQCLKEPEPLCVKYCVPGAIRVV